MGQVTESISSIHVRNQAIKKDTSSYDWMTTERFSRYLGESVGNVATKVESHITSCKEFWGSFKVNGYELGYDCLGHKHGEWQEAAGCPALDELTTNGVSSVAMVTRGCHGNLIARGQDMLWGTTRAPKDQNIIRANSFLFIWGFFFHTAPPLVESGSLLEECGPYPVMAREKTRVWGAKGDNTITGTPHSIIYCPCLGPSPLTNDVNQEQKPMEARELNLKTYFPKGDHLDQLSDCTHTSHAIAALPPLFEHPRLPLLMMQVGSIKLGLSAQPQQRSPFKLLQPATIHPLIVLQFWPS